MEADFSGYATKAGLKCSDGKTIMPGAFKHQDTMQVPLVWQHGHTDPQNVLGHATLEEREDGVYAYGFFNKSEKAKHTRELLEHKDIKAMSIWANDLVMRADRVLHGAIREVSLVLSGANPGALIENVTIRHSNGPDEELEDEAIIYTGIPLEHSSKTVPEVKPTVKEETVPSVKEVYDDMTDIQKTVVHSMLGEALSSSDRVQHAADDAEDPDMDPKTVQDVYDSMSNEQKQVLHYLIGEALESADESGTDTSATDAAPLKQSNLDEDNNDPKGNTMKHNVFEDSTKDGKGTPVILSHSDVKEIVSSAVKNGSLKDAVEEYALAHGIDNINLLFPEAGLVDSPPEWLKRRTLWVDTLLQATRKSPFSRIKTLSADITMETARAKGYVKGAFKKEEFFSVAKRITTPTTVYKKQKLDRDDMIDITDFDVVAWLKSEMRLMLDEEIARAILIGDGRDVSSEDKINEQNVRPIAKDHELYSSTLYVNVDDANSTAQEVIDSIITNRSLYKGTGNPSFFTTETWIAKFLLLKDTTGRRIYKSIDEVALDFRVDALVPVEVMEEVPDIIGILVNPVDYVIGADKGGEVSLFDFFDIDYNQYKYLIETRVCGALVKLKSALVVRKVAAVNVLIDPVTSPTYNSTTKVVTIPTQSGVTYKNSDTGATLTAGAQAPIAAGATLNVLATANSGFYFGTTAHDEWNYRN